MRYLTVPRLVVFVLCLSAPRLPAGTYDFGNDREKLQASFDQFPLLNLRTNEAGWPAFQTLTLTNPVMSNGRDFHGFRFQVPHREHGEDFVWAFGAVAGHFDFYIVPQTGQMSGFTDFDMVHKADYPETDRLFPREGTDLCLQRLAGESLEDGKTYLIWFAFENNKPAKLSLAFTFADLGLEKTNKVEAIGNALGLSRPLSRTMVNPNNHHAYILLRQATWQQSEAQAVALGGHLATVRNQAEEDWLFKTFGSYGGRQRLLWIGLSDTAKKFHFGWSSGESTSYTCWAPGEPNNAGWGEDFAAIYYPNHDQAGKWNDWSDQTSDPIGLPMNGVVEIIPNGRDLAGPATNPMTMTNRLAPAPASANPGTGDITTTGLAAVDIRPTLVITNDSGNIKLQWPVSMSDYMLETTTNLDQPFTMFGYSEMTNLDAGVVYATVTNPAPHMFFRLRRP